MFTTGSKVLISSSVVAIGLAVAYGVIAGGALGTFGLISAAVAVIFLAVTYIAVRDANVSAMDHDAFPSAAASQVGARPSLWPLLTAIGVALTAYGLVSNVAFVLVGVVLVLSGGVEWMVQNWSEHISNDPAYNEVARQQLANPLEVPVGGAIVAGIVAFGFSRVMLGVPSTEATIVAFIVVAASVLAIAAWFAIRPGVSTTAIVSTFSIAILALAVAGLAFGIDGPREIELHETTAYLAEENECGPEETHADIKASESVAAKSSVAARIMFDGSELHGNIPGLEGDFDPLTLYRTNPNNIIFLNEGSEPARLVIDLHPPAPADGEEQTFPERVCTALTDPGATQFLTVYFRRNTVGVQDEYGEGYAFNVPGSDANLEVIVP